MAKRVLKKARKAKAGNAARKNGGEGCGKDGRGPQREEDEDHSRTSSIEARE